MSKILAYLHYDCWLDVAVEQNAIMPTNRTWFPYRYGPYHADVEEHTFHSGQRTLPLSIVLQNPKTYSTHLHGEDPQELLAELEQALCRNSN